MFEKKLKILTSDRFIPQLYYASETNIAKGNLYKRFDISDEIIVHKNIYDKLVLLIPVLKGLKLKLIVTDAYRPLEIHKYLNDNWEKLTGKKASRSLASIENAPHSRCTVINVVLVDEDGKRKSLPSSSIKINPEQRNSDYVFSDSPEGYGKREK
ncbi:MAG: hypothetical protein LBT14_13910 [Treponema sp.]|jgi:D-alanyl-D-alanine dipeptidase|nr:hypothetical protein [Treponema sp.]